MHKILTLLFTLTAWTMLPALGQQNNRENVFLHLSNSELIVGETLYFSCFVHSEITGKLSLLSSILYIEILDQDNKSVYTGQLNIEDGVGAGRVYLSTELETGNYNIIAYTRWMRNFDKFFQQEITIINPYRTYFNPDESALKTKVSFYAEGGNILSGVRNNLSIKITDKFGRWKMSTGRVINGSGNTLMSFDSTTIDCLKLSFVPKANEIYQLILENGSEFEFYNLPAQCLECTRMLIEEKNGQLRIDLKSGFSNNPRHNLVIKSQKEIVSRLQVFPNSETIISKSELPKGLLEVILLIDDEPYSQRLYWNGDQMLNLAHRTAEYKILDSISMSFDIPMPAVLSISVSGVPIIPRTVKDITIRHAIDEQLIEPLPGFDSFSLIDKLNWLLLTTSSKSNYVKANSRIYLPEYRYGIIQGKLTDYQKKPIKHELIGISLLGNGNNISVTKSDSTGWFALPYDHKSGSRYISLSAINLESGSYEISILEPLYEDFENLSATPFRLDSATIKKVIERSVHNQIQNAYKLAAPDSSAVEANHVISGAVTYKIDEYTRFQTMRDTFIEIIKSVGVSKNENKFDFRFQLAGIDFNDKNPRQPLILLNGIFSNAKEILELSPYNVDRIVVLNKRYYFGEIYFDGVISVFAKRQKIKGDQSSTYSYQTPEQLDFHHEITVDLKEVRIPHYENLLYWQPYLIHKGGKLQISFNSSEVRGLFEIKIEGITDKGTPISRKKYFKIQ